MLTTPLWQGLTLSLAMIVPIGAQNAFVLEQGIRRHHHLMVAAICVACDIALVSLGVFGAGAALGQSPALLSVVTAAGCLFLAAYGLFPLKNAWRPAPADAPGAGGAARRGRFAVALATLAVTLLNPHVYLDTLVILGAIGGQLAAHERPWFALGSALAALCWFSGLSLGAARYAATLSRPRVKRAVDAAVGSLMLILAGQLARTLWQP